MNRFLAIYAACAYAFLHAPLLVLTVFSFNESRFTIWEGFSLRWYAATLRDPQILESALNSLIIALAATALSTVAGTVAAHALRKWRAPLLEGTLYLSLVTPEIVTGVSLLALFQFLFRFLRLHLGMHTVILAHVAFCLPYVVLVVGARLRQFDTQIEEAAADLGASEFETFWHVTLPNLWPVIGAAALLAFTVSFDDYVITSLVAGVDSETLPMTIYALARRGANPMLNAVSTLIVSALGILIVVSGKWQRS